MIRISHKRGECIGCAACVEQAPSYWKMDEDGLASLVKVKNNHKQIEIGEGYDCDREELVQSAESCPVHIISIK